jgi:hypothetical protein
LLGQAIYHLHWSPAVFWAATLHEIEAAMEAADSKSSNSDDEKPSPEMQALLDARRAKKEQGANP